MRKALAVFACVLGFSAAAQATVVIEIDAGFLSYINGITQTALPQGSLVQLIASPVSGITPDGVFGAPTTGSFVTGSDIIVASFAMNYGFATGETDNTISITLGAGAGQVPAGDALLLRWYHGTTYSSSTNYSTAAPTAGSTYGQYRSDTQESDEAGLTWFVPSTDGATYNYPTGLDFQTLTAGGSNPDLTGEAILALSPIPEPSTYAMFGAGFMGLIGLHAWNRRKGSSLAT